MKVWRFLGNEIEVLKVRPVPDHPNRVLRGCSYCSRQLIMGRDVFATRLGAIRSRRRELEKSLHKVRARLVSLEAEAAGVLQLESEERARARKAKKRA